MKAFFKNQLGHILYGFIFWFPIGIAIIALGYLFGNLENSGKEIINFLFPNITIYPGIVTLIWIIIFLLTGIILKKTPINKFLSKVPVLGLFFGEGQIVTLERLLHLTPCLFLYSPTCISYGWILSEEKTKLDDKENNSPSLINVYYPNVPTLITGQIFPVRKETVIKLGNSSKEIIDLLLYAFKSPAHIKYLPWPDEDAEVFEKRAANFGKNSCTG